MRIRNRHILKKFKALFPDHTLYLECTGEGRDALGVVKQTVLEGEKLERKSRREVDFKWAVFDKDDSDSNSTKRSRFEQAFELAKDNNIKLAYSNEVFELWLLLHFREVDSNRPIPRQEVYELLGKVVREYEGNEDFEYVHGKTGILDKVSFLGNEEEAISRAKVLAEKFKAIPPIEANPSTKVHILVEDLRGWIEYYNFPGKGKKWK